MKDTLFAFFLLVIVVMLCIAIVVYSFVNKVEPETFKCTVTTLESYGMEGEPGDVLCVNPDDKADFILINGYLPGDKLKIEVTK